MTVGAVNREKRWEKERERMPCLRLSLAAAHLHLHKEAFSVETRLLYSVGTAGVGTHTAFMSLPFRPCLCMYDRHIGFSHTKQLVLFLLLSISIKAIPSSDLSLHCLAQIDRYSPLFPGAYPAISAR